jgi:hypothetical protein
LKKKKFHGKNLGSHNFGYHEEDYKFDHVLELYKISVSENNNPIVAN